MPKLVSTTSAKDWVSSTASDRQALSYKDNDSNLYMN